MSDEIERLLVRVEANAAQFDAQMKKINRSIYGSQAETRKALTAIKRDTTAMSRTMFQPVGDAFRREVAGLSGILAGLFTAAQVTKYADAYTGLQNRLKAAGLEGEALARVENALYAAAERNGVAVDAVAQLYQRAALSKKSLGATDEQIIRLTDGVSAALRVQGVSAQAASGPLLQLGQALGGGIVRAEELNSLLEGTPIILQAAAAGSAKYAGNVNAMAKAVRDGKVTSQEFFAALMKGLPEIEKRAADLPKTIGQALQSLDNAFGRYIGQTDASLSASQRVAGAIDALAQNLDTVVPIVTTLAAVIGGAYVLSLSQAAAGQIAAGISAARLTGFNIAMTASMTGATRAQVALNMAMAANPVGLVVTLVAALAAGLYLLASRYNTTAVAARALDQVVGKADNALEDYRKAVLSARDASKEERAELEKKAAALRAVTLARINDAKVEAQRQIDEAVSARQRADNAIEDSGAARQASFRNPTNATAALAAGASSNARAAITLAGRARAEADTAIQAYERLKGAMEEIENPRSLAAGGAATTDAGSGGGKGSADRIADLRARLDLEERMAAARATGDKRAIEMEEERQRLVELTERYREAGYSDAAMRALQMVAAENQAKDIEEDRERLAERRREWSELEADLKRRALDWTQRQYDLELDLARVQGDPATIKKLEREAELRQRIAEYVERFGLAGAGLAVAEQMRVDGARDGREAADQIEDASRVAARHFVDVLAADDWASAAGQKFRDAAFNGLEDLLTTVFKQIGTGEGGNLLGSIAKGVKAVFGGGRASGGPVTAGRAYRINENTPNSEYFVPGVSGRVVTAAQAASGQGANLVRGGVVEHRVIVVPDRDSFVQLAADTAQPMAEMARAGAVGDVAAAQAVSNRRAQLRTRR
ncbi:MAG: tape measure protein [Ferrovibrionaceae bacterium]|uniref:tape measure protein n=1 Tax=Brevundimonas sp. TaxID=1871086 RepID=UPI0040342FB5